jgi:hypothetical protein
MPKPATKGRGHTPEPSAEFMTTGFHLPKSLWELLNRVAFERARTKGGRASVSALLVELIEKHKKQLEREIAASR